MGEHLDKTCGTSIHKSMEICCRKLFEVTNWWKRLGNWTLLDLSNNWTSETQPNFQLHITSLDEFQPSIWIQKGPWLTGYCWHSTGRQRDCMICESAKTSRCLNKWTYMDLITYWWKKIMHQLIGTLLGRSPCPHYQGMFESMIFSFSPWVGYKFHRNFREWTWQILGMVTLKV